jgi:MoaA/NifB/PqqE/SkfB family radical SAM enzyme
MIRIYININNVCNANCEFCCMYSGTHKKTFMPFDTFKDIIDGNCARGDDFELQLEGGEPLINPNLYLFMWYAWSTKQCKKIIITTNGKLLRTHLNRLVNFAGETKLPVQVKMSINYWLLAENADLCKHARDIHLATEFLDYFSIRFNVRLRNDGDEQVMNEIRKYKIEDQCNIYNLQSYGKLSGNPEYESPIIVQNIDDWFIYSCDGQPFNKDLVARSKHEETVP